VEISKWMKDRKKCYDKRNILKLEEETISFFKLNIERFSNEASLLAKKKKSKSKSKTRKGDETINPEEARISIRMSTEDKEEAESTVANTLVACDTSVGTMVASAAGDTSA